jgi:hypothetical protein
MELTIEISGNNLNDIFKLECVKSISKMPDGNLCVSCFSDMMEGSTLAFAGDKLTQVEPQHWIIIKNNNNE